MRNKTVLISGASIAGPALAYWLSRYGFEVTVVERAPQLRPGGQAVDFTGETHRKVLEQMGILDEIYAHRTGTTDTVFVDADGAQLASMSGDFTGGDVEILRGDLARIMYEKTYQDCEYVFGDSISALTETGDGVWVEFEKGAPHGFDLVFGADGIHSRVRRLAFGPEKEFVKHLGHYYCVAGASPWATKPEGTPERMTAYGYNEPGKCVITAARRHSSSTSSPRPNSTTPVTTSRRSDTSSKRPSPTSAGRRRACSPKWRSSMTSSWTRSAWCAR